MKKIIEGLSLPFFLIVGYLSHILFLFYTTQRIPNIPDAIIIGFLSILYGFSVYMKHIKKPDAHLLLEEKFEEFLEAHENKIKEMNKEHEEDVQMINENIEDIKEDLSKDFQLIKTAFEKDLQLINDKVSIANLNKGIKPSNPQDLASSLGWGK
jgi:hypothetical protein